MKTDAFLLITRADEKGSIGVKSRDPQNAHLRPVLNVLAQFKLPSSIWRGVNARTSSEKEKKRPKNYFFGAVKGCNGVETLRPPKGTSSTPT